MQENVNTEYVIYGLPQKHAKDNPIGTYRSPGN